MYLTVIHVWYSRRISPIQPTNVPIVSCFGQKCLLNALNGNVSVPQPFKLLTAGTIKPTVY